MHQYTVRRPLDVVQYEVVGLFVDDHVEQILDGKAVGHELVGPEHETSRHDDVEQRVNQSGRGFKHCDDRHDTFTHETLAVILIKRIKTTY